MTAEQRKKSKEFLSKSPAKYYARKIKNSGTERTIAQRAYVANQDQRYKELSRNQ